ncbi:MAG: PaaI family thioesterase [Rhizomicrobium sp.]
MSDPSSHQVQDTPAARLLSREVLSVDAETGEVTLRFVAKPEFANRHGTVQGGFLAAMLDSATGMAVMLSLPPDMTAVTTRLDVSYLKPASIGPLRATSRVTARDTRSANVEARLMDDAGLELATANAELRILSRRP